MFGFDEIKILSCLDFEQDELVFFCQNCQQESRKTIKGKVLQLLHSNGTKVETWSIPEEYFETKQGQPVNHDDLLDFHIHLKDEQMFAQALKELNV